MVGLGCEVFQIDRMKEEYGLVEGDHFRTMTIQATGGTKKTVAEGVERIKAMIPIAARAKRETRPASEITLALQCGGSDGYSGITANPALGAAVDELVKHGGTAILSETPEIYDAEHLLTRRAVNRAVGEKLVERIKWWEAYCERNGGEMNNNPSPGNKAGGDRKSTRLNSSHRCISYAVFCLKKKKRQFSNPEKAKQRPEQAARRT